MVVNCHLGDQVDFEPVSNVTNVFYDDRNKQVFSVRSGGATGILVKGFEDEMCSTYRMEDQGPIISIKLSPDQTILAVQRTKNKVQFVPVQQSGIQVPNLDCTKEYFQSSKSKSAIVQGFYWLSSSEIMFVTSLGIEMYGVMGEKRATKTLKHLSQAVSWSRYCPSAGVMVISQTPTGPTLLPFVIRSGGIITKLPKIDHSLVTGGGSVNIKEKDVGIHTLYGNKVFITVISRDGGAALQDTTDGSDAEPGSPTSHVTIHLYLIAKDSVVRTHVFHTPFQGGGIAINVVDNLMVAHHQASGTSATFDVALKGESDGHISHHKPIGDPIKIHHPTSLTATPSSSDKSSSVASSSYSPNWVMFSPDIIIDAKQGSMWRLKNNLDLSRLKKTTALSNHHHMSLQTIVSFLLQRDRAKPVLLDVLLDWCQFGEGPGEETDLTIGEAFDLINREYRAYLDAQVQNNLALSSSPFYSTNSSSSASSAISASQSCRDFSSQAVGTTSSTSTSSATSNVGQSSPTSWSSSSAKVIIDQSDLYSNLFVPLVDQGSSDINRAPRRRQRLVDILLEYSRSLEEKRIPVQHFLSEVLVHLLVQNESWYQLHQLLQYRVISDSKQLACLLLSLESVYPASTQLALDMLTRLRNSSEEICEILLSKGRVLSALQFADDRGLVHRDALKARKFLDAASSVDQEDERRAVFYSTFNFFKQKSMLHRGCDQHVELYNKMFPE